jgi:hypothetical protein
MYKKHSALVPTLRRQTSSFGFEPPEVLYNFLWGFWDFASFVSDCPRTPNTATIQKRLSAKMCFMFRLLGTNYHPRLVGGKSSHSRLEAGDTLSNRKHTKSPANFACDLLAIYKV